MGNVVTGQPPVNKFRDNLRRILQVRINHHQGITRGMLHPCGDCQLVAEIARQADHADLRVRILQFSQQVHRRIGASVVHVENLERHSNPAEGVRKPAMSLTQDSFFIGARNNHGEQWRVGVLGVGAGGLRAVLVLSFWLHRVSLRRDWPSHSVWWPWSGSGSSAEKIACSPSCLASRDRVLRAQRTPTKIRFKRAQPPEEVREKHDIVQPDPLQSSLCEVTQRLARRKQDCILIEGAASNGPASERIRGVVLKNNHAPISSKQLGSTRNGGVARPGPHVVQNVGYYNHVIIPV